MALMLPAVKRRPRVGPARPVPEQSQAIWSGAARVSYRLRDLPGRKRRTSNPPYSYAGGWWAFQARLLPYMESKNIYKLCNFSYHGDCFDWIAIQPPGMNPGVMIPSTTNVPMTR